MKITETKSLLRSIISIAVLLVVSNTTAIAAKGAIDRDPNTPALIDSIVRTMQFQFEPLTLHGQANGVWVPTKHSENTNLPLWVMINMGGPMIFDTTQYRLNKIEQVDKAWLINATLSDTLSGEFELQFIIEASGKSLLKLTDSEGYKQLFEGRIYPRIRTVTFAKEKELKRALETQAVIDSIVPMLTYQVNYTLSGDYNLIYKYYRSYGTRMPLDAPTIEPSRILVTPRILQNQFATLRYMEKVNEYWFIRLEYLPERQPLQKRAYTDYCINSLTGQTYVRGGYFDRIPSTWRHYKERAGFTNPA